MPCFNRFKSDIFSKITGEDGVGPIKTYVHKASNVMRPDLILLVDRLLFIKVYPWTEIRSALQEMAENKNRKVIS